MLTAELGDSLQQLTILQDEVRKVCVHKPERWRHDVLRLRRDISDEIGRIGTFVASEVGSDRPTYAAFRNAFSLFRSVVAELQASWPAVSLDPEASSYKQMADRVRSSFEALKASLVEIERGASTKSQRE